MPQNLINWFPKELESPPRSQQVNALNFIEQSFNNGINVVICEMPVGAGKSPVATTLSRSFSGGIITTPRVQLQQQYLNDFDRTSPLIGRSRFGCIKLDPEARKSIEVIKGGDIPSKPILEQSCAAGPCLSKPTTKRERIKQECENNGGCPHQVHIDVANQTETVVSNLHSLAYSVSLNERIGKPNVLVMDEAHNLESFIRDFAKLKFTIRRKVLHSEVATLKTTEQWKQWLVLPEQTALLTTEELRDSYLARIEKLAKLNETVQQYWDDPRTGHLVVELQPTYCGGLAQSLLFGLSDKIVLMSGTILSKDLYCKPLGLDPQKVALIQIPSDFPLENRPVYLPRHKDLDLSYKHWGKNITRACQEIKRIMEKHPNQKGLIHVNSYRAAKQIAEMLNSKRVLSHESEDFQTKLKHFYNSKDHLVFISPVISEGYDFKDDLARWQIVVSPAYPSINDPYIKNILDKGYWQSYNYETLKTFLQTLGRVVRSNGDWGATYCLDSRFYGFLKKTWGLIPKWQQEAFKHE